MIQKEKVTDFILVNLQEKFEEETSKMYNNNQLLFEQIFIDANKMLEKHNYLSGFIKQFDPEEGELDEKEWTAREFLKWLEANKFKIVT